MIRSDQLAALARGHLSGSNGTRAEAVRLRLADPGPRQQVFLSQLQTAGQDVPASLLPAVAEAVAHEQPDLSEAESLAAAHDLLSGVVADDPWIGKGLPRTFEDLMNNPGSRGRLLFESRHGAPDSSRRAKALLRDFTAAWEALAAEFENTTTDTAEGTSPS